MGFLTSPANQSKLKVARINSRRFIYEISLEQDRRYTANVSPVKGMGLPRVTRGTP